MLKDIKALGRESLIYGLSTVVARLLSFLLMPFYTHYLSPGDYGVVATVFSCIAFLNIVYQYGMDQAYMRHYSEKEKAFPAAYSCVIVTSAVFSLALAAFPGHWAELGGIPGYGELVRYAAVILFLDAINVIPLAELRMLHRPFYFAGVRMAAIALNVGLNILFLAKFGWGIKGIFIANVASSLLSVLAVPRRISFRVDRDMLLRLADYALPLLPAGLGAMAVQVLDRPIMVRLTDTATVGLYQASYRLGIFMMLVVSMFDQAWRPFFIERSHKPEGPAVFARVLTYFTTGGLFVWLLMSFYAADVARARFFGVSLISPRFWEGLGIVPIILGAYFLNGVYVNLLAPVIIAKRTRAILGVTLTGAAVSIGGNFALIPLFGMYGAAWAALLSYAVMCLMIYSRGHCLYPVPYEWARLGRVALVTAVCALPVFLVRAQGLPGFFLKAVCLGAYPVLVWLFGALSEEEKAEAAGLASRLL